MLPTAGNTKSAERERQEAAFDEIQTIDWWFRKQFNLAPTDERYLNATKDDMWLEYWAVEFDTRWARAAKAGKEVNEIEDLFDPTGEDYGQEMSDAEFWKQLHELEAMDEIEALKGTPTPVAEPSRVALAVEDNSKEQVLIRFRRA